MNKGFSVLKVLFCKEEVFSILHELINIESGLPKDISVIGCASEDKLSELILKNSANKKNVIFCDNQQISIVKLNELEKIWQIIKEKYRYLIFLCVEEKKLRLYLDRS